ncbi:MAG: hypothetical protein Nk1A_8600 [Endomicrobiia bacterium]|nr:MAG: hypothetical protein Nk1A_8600 [Endomicrobiia bacterium]
MYKSDVQLCAPLPNGQTAIRDIDNNVIGYDKLYLNLARSIHSPWTTAELGGKSKDLEIRYFIEGTGTNESTLP